jgi:hypothetical protein
MYKRFRFAVFGIFILLIFFWVYQRQSSDIFLDFYLGMRPKEYNEKVERLKKSGTFQWVKTYHDDPEYRYAYWFSFNDGTGLKMAVCPNFNSKNLESFILKYYCYKSDCVIQNEEVQNLRSLFEEQYGEGKIFSNGEIYSVGWTSGKIDITLMTRKSIGDSTTFSYAIIQYEFSEEEKNLIKDKYRTKPSDI